MTMTLTTPCAHCGVPVTHPIPDYAALAAYVVLGALCAGCAARQAIAREMQE